jgi:glycine/D-amino acid oxidase-like deaminating enzyme
VGSFETVVIGGGLVGTAAAYGLAGCGVTTALIDEGDIAHRASRGNFCLVWVQGKGDGSPSYAAWARESAELFPDFGRELQDSTGVDIGYSKLGGVKLCFSDTEMAEREVLLERIKAYPGAADFEMMDRNALDDLVPGLGPDIVGASYCIDDGHCSAPYLLRALHAGFLARGGRYLNGAGARQIRPRGKGFTIDVGERAIETEQVILAAGLDNARLAPMVGLHVPIKPNRGQILVTERLQPILNVPTNFIRQTQEGSIMIGDSHEDVGFDDGTTAGVTGDIARYGVRVFPFLAGARIVRVWGCLRTWPPDGFPIYDQSTSHAGAFVLNCHSGVSLAANHATRLVEWIRNDDGAPNLEAFSTDRFDIGVAA